MVPYSMRFVDVTERDIASDGTVIFEAACGVGGQRLAVERRRCDELYPVENVVQRGTNIHLRTSYKRCFSKGASSVRAAQTFSPALWSNFVERATIPRGFRNAGMKYAGYIASGRNSWCLPSWIWTNAAIARYYCAFGDIEEAVNLGNKFLAIQTLEGGWVVRSDYGKNGEIPVLAPNDSAYVANNALLNLYNQTGNEAYLSRAESCAKWVMQTSRADGLVWTGYDTRAGKWLTDRTIVDIGFTAALFARLYSLTGRLSYRKFLEKFLWRYIELFYDECNGGFATYIDTDNKKSGGQFTRGQAWALEGLIPAYSVLGDERLKEVIERNVGGLIKHQLSNGAWPYNINRKYLGEDCKGVAVIAKALLDWHAITRDPRLIIAAGKAMEWCEKRTSLSGESQGGIFSFNMEGAIVHNHYTKTALVYSSSYALELSQALRDNG